MIQINQEINNQNNQGDASENLQNDENKQSLRAQRYQMQKKAIKPEHRKNKEQQGSSNTATKAKHILQ